MSAIYCFSQDTINSYKIKYYTRKVQNYLDKEKALSPYYSINKNGVSIYASAQDKKSDKIEFHIDWDELENFRGAVKSYSTDSVMKRFIGGKYHKEANEIYKPSIISSPQKKLYGYRIAIDPGHIAHNFETADLEKKHIKFKKDSLHTLPDSIEFSEGMITYATAKLLKAKLEADGAEIFLTRPNGYSAFGKTFDQWLKDDLKNAVDSLYKIGELKLQQKQYFLSDKAEKTDIFRVIFKDLELAKRAELINNYRPDFTVIIHYNVDETNSGWIKPTTKNFNMAFIGGAFMKHDLITKEKRFEFLRLLVTNDIENSILLSTEVVNNFEAILKVKLTGANDAKYIGQACLPTDTKGVYCRNLQLTRFIHSPLVYGETLYQDNIIECQLLNEETDKTKNERVKQVAESYYQGILKYIETNP
jgi:N-acetylmuramoyl-L-alanine amidase